MEYLEGVVDACEPDGDPHDWKGWYRSLMLRDDHAIDTIWRKLRGLAKQLSGRGTEARNAVAAALRYIRFRKSKMRYAAHYAANLPIGSGDLALTTQRCNRRRLGDTEPRCPASQNRSYYHAFISLTVTSHCCDSRRFSTGGILAVR